MPDARLAMPQMLCTLRGVKVTEHSWNDERLRGVVVPWGQVEAAGDYVLLFDGDGVRVARMPVPADQRRTLRYARRRAIARAVAAKTLEVTVGFNLRANRRDGGLIALLFAVVLVPILASAVRDWNDESTARAIFLLGFSVAVASFVGWFVLDSHWRSNLRRVRICTNGLDAEFADGRTVIVDWADVQRVRHSGLSVIIQTREHGPMRFVVELPTRRAITALQAYRPADWPRARTVPEQLRLLKWYGLVGSVLVGTLSWTLGLDAWRVLIATLMPAGLIAILYGIDWFVRHIDRRARSKRPRRKQAVLSLPVESA